MYWPVKKGISGRLRNWKTVKDSRNISGLYFLNRGDSEVIDYGYPIHQAGVVQAMQSACAGLAWTGNCALLVLE
jgi:hypothetical protein